MRPFALASLSLPLVAACHSLRAPAAKATALQQEPHAHFVAGKRSGLAPFSVGFTNMSSGTITQWQWIFGDGSVSTDEHPIHVYRKPGTYTVSLLVIGPGGSDLETKQSYVVAREATVRRRLPNTGGTNTGDAGDPSQGNDDNLTAKW